MRHTRTTLAVAVCVIAATPVSAEELDTAAEEIDTTAEDIDRAAEEIEAPTEGIATAAEEIDTATAGNELNAAEAEAAKLATPAARQGYYLSGAIYFALQTNFDDERWFKSWPGFSMNLRAGQALFDWLDVGLAFDFGMGMGKKRQGMFGGLSLEGQFHPIEDLSIRAGVGFGFLSVKEQDAVDDSETLGGVGDYYTVAVSYDWFPFYDGGSGGFAISPIIQARFMRRMDVNALLGWVGIELTWWAGLPDNRLDLPIDEAFRKE